MTKKEINSHRVQKRDKESVWVTCHKGRLGFAGSASSVIFATARIYPRKSTAVSDKLCTLSPSRPLMHLEIQAGCQFFHKTLRVRTASEGWLNSNCFNLERISNFKCQEVYCLMHIVLWKGTKHSPTTVTQDMGLQFSKSL
jgi:hypothetical protein